MSGKGGTEARAAVVLLVTMTVWSAALGRVWAQVTTPAEPPPTTEPAPSTTGPFPGATVRVFDTLAPLGATPGESLEDPTGLTGHGTSFPTIVTTYARDNHPVGPSGLSYWNPDCGLFTLYGKTVGFPGGVDINLTGPVQSAPSFAFGDVTFGPGDVWVPGLQEHPLYVHFAGTNRFRTFGTPSRTTPSEARAFGVKVDQRTGNVFVALPADGNLVRVDPTAPQSPGFVATIEAMRSGGRSSGGVSAQGRRIDHTPKREAADGPGVASRTSLNLPERMNELSDGVIGSMGSPRARHAGKPPSSGLTRVTPCRLRLSATRALVASLGHEPPPLPYRDSASV